MAKSGRKTVLFLGAVGLDPCRLAETLFDSVAVRMGLPWRAASRGLAPDLATADDLEAAALVVVLERGERLPPLPERFPAWGEKAESWHVADASEAPERIERAVMGLVARLLGGGSSQEAEPAEAAPAAPAAKGPPRKQVTLKVGRETAGRRGKGVTTVFDLPFGEEGVRELAALLKQRCGTGGTVKDGRIEIQGDQRERVVAELEKLGYKVKRVGG